MTCRIGDRIISDKQNNKSSLSRALTLLDAFSRDEPELSLTEIAARAGLPKSTTHRLVADLVSWGALERRPSGLRLGMRLFELGHLVPDTRALRDVALPFMEDLHRTTRRTINLAIRDELDVVYVEKLVASDFSVPHSRAGGRLPLHCTGLGKVLLAFGPSELFDEVVAAGLQRLTAHTIVDANTLRSELDRVRSERVAYDFEESFKGLHCVAAPLFNRRGAVVGALSITDLQNRSSARRAALALLTVSVLLSRALSGRPQLDGAV